MRTLPSTTPRALSLGSILAQAAFYREIKKNLLMANVSNPSEM
jgi:hypothetical protein